MQGLADGYFVIPYTVGNYLADEISTGSVPTSHPAFEETEKAVADRINTLMSINGKQTVESFHKRLGKIVWDKCGMARSAEGLKQAIQEIRDLLEKGVAPNRDESNFPNVGPSVSVPITPVSEGTPVETQTVH